MNGLLPKTFRKFSLIDRICQCLSIIFLIIYNVLLKLSNGNGKFRWADGFPLFSNSFFYLHSWFYLGNGPEF